MAEYIERTEELMLAMNAGARAIENTKRYHGAVYIADLFSDNPQEIPYLQAAKVLREVSDAPAADVEPVRRGNWNIRLADEMTLCLECSECGRKVDNIDLHYLLEAGEYGKAFRRYPYCHCGAKMQGAENE